MQSLRMHVFLAITLTFAGVGWADAPQVTYEPRAAFSETDKNKDDRVDIGEFHARVVEVFYSADTNKDGYLQVVEIERLPFREAILEVDRNGDTKIDLREFVRIRVHQFLEVDTDGDIELSAEEVITAYEGEEKE